MAVVVLLKICLLLSSVLMTNSAPQTPVHTEAASILQFDLSELKNISSY